MKVVITGASGKTGYRVAEEALKKSLDVHLVLRKDSKLPENLQNCKKSYISLDNQEELDTVLKEKDALVIATGARPSIDLTGPAKVDACGVKAQVDSCKRVGLKRVILVSSLCAGRLIHPLNLFGLILIWKKIGEDALRRSELDWSIIRPGGLLEKEEDIERESIKYTSINKQVEGSIPRRLVAKCCIEALYTSNSIKETIEITSNENENEQTLKQAINAFQTVT
tara:strand:- start:91 stop:765 length:675 start_codon:yes stop_codon:yes gene_type:complete